MVWCLRRGTNQAVQFHVPVLPIIDVGLHVELEQLDPRCEDVVIDAGGLDESDLQTALIASRVIVVPACMQPRDVPAVAAALEQAGGFHPEARMIIAVALRRDGDTTASEAIASRLLAALPSAKLAHAVIRDSASVAAAFRQGLTVFETAPADELAAQIEGLAAEVYGGTENAPDTEQEIRAAMAAVESSRHGARCRSRA